MSAETIARLRAMMAREDIDAVILSHPHDVRYATGYHSVLERWTQQEPLCGAIVPRDASKPVTLLIPEASIGVIAVGNEREQRIFCDEIRTFDMLNFCQVARADDPGARRSELARAALGIASEKIRGACQPDLLAALSQGLKANGLDRRGRIGCDDWRIGHRATQGMQVDLFDALDFLMRVRVVKTPGEIARYRKVGKLADAVIAQAGREVVHGRSWSEVQARIAEFMVRNEVVPVDEGAVLFGGGYDGDFIPDLFRTPVDRPLQSGDIIILETQGVHEGFWIDINRTAVVGPPSAEYLRLHDILRDAFLKTVDHLRPGVHTGELAKIARDHLVQNGVAAPDKLLLVAHGIGYMPLEIPVPFPSHGLAGVAGFEMAEDMLISLDCLYFGGTPGPCHMENVYAITSGAPEPMYHAPLELFVAEAPELAGA
ncbi:aminopeptidase P family protein [Sphingobium phenoxybenzoativorans]|uniref:Aminopeptidase P family protein n=1 Tax=Sphingobium phenoxybenzoativorans TaxID=1592790 RepID=A0A975KA87_9SPHN|nr:M24 family metallopeptidase [Sphingobium phenoxybenzoativorans]QUT07352.1 aminopeptidase P family protein [Sphingobium phenoxybenzoativorans]